MAKSIFNSGNATGLVTDKMARCFNLVYITLHKVSAFFVFQLHQKAFNSDKVTIKYRCFVILARELSNALFHEGIDFEFNANGEIIF